MSQNLWNSIICLGHSNGIVSMWTQSLSSPVINLSCHKGPVLAIANDPFGRFLTTTGVDCRVKIWDLRKLQPLHQYTTHSAITCADVSPKGFMAFGCNTQLQIWRNFSTKKKTPPYL